MTTKPVEFKRFFECIPEELRDDLKFIPVKHNKSPDVNMNIKENIQEIRLSVEEAKERLKSGKNVGLYLSEELVCLDVDRPDKAKEMIEELPTSLRVKSRSGKPHIYFLRGDGIEGCDYEDIIELRTGWRYVLVPGSYAYDQKEYEEIGEKRWGTYEVTNSQDLATLEKKDLPEELTKEDVSNVEVNTDEVFRNKSGEKLKDILKESNDEKFTRLMEDLNPPGYDYPSKSEADLAATSKLLKLGFDDSTIIKILRVYRSREKMERDDYLKRTLRKAKEGLNKWTQKVSSEDAIEVTPSEIRAEHIQEKVRMRGRIKAQKTQKAMPQVVKIRCKNCGENVVINIDDYSYLKKRYLFSGINVEKRLESVGKEGLSDSCDPDDKRKSHSVDSHIDEYTDYSIVWMDDLLEDKSSFTNNESSEMKVAVVGSNIPNSRKVEVEGEVLVESSSDDIVIIAENIEPVGILPDNLELSEDVLHDFTKYFGGDDDILFQIAPDMVGRHLVRESRLLTLHSPREIPDVDGDTTIRGSLREILIGDTKTYKSKSVKDLTDEYYHLGDYASAETGSRAGLVYSVDMDKNALRWGTLPLNDKGYVGLDGLNKLHSEEMKELREILESQKIVVRKYVSGEALARVRISACMNPPEVMNQYLTPADAIKDASIFKNTPDLTRWDIFLPFSDDDIEEKRLVNRETKDRPVPDNVFKKHVYWAWSREPGHIQYEEEAVDRIKEGSEHLIETYKSTDLPIIHNGIRDVITRISVAYACLKHSTENHKKIIVKEEHVKLGIDFYERMLKDLELEKHKEMMEEGIKIGEDDFLDFTIEMDEHHVKILGLLIKEKTCSSAYISSELDISRRNVKNKYELLKEYGLIETKPGKGSTLTKRGVKFIRRLIGFDDGDIDRESISKLREMVKEYFTKSSDSAPLKEQILRILSDADRVLDKNEIFQNVNGYDRDEVEAELHRLKDEEDCGVVSPSINDKMWRMR